MGFKVGTLSLQAQNLPFQQILSTVDFFFPLDCLTIMGLDWTGPITLIILFLVSHFVFFNSVWLPISLLLHAKYTLSCHVVSYNQCSEDKQAGWVLAGCHAVGRH